MGEMAQEVTAQMVATGGATAIAAAVAKFRKHMHGRCQAAVESDGPDTPSRSWRAWPSA
jgi:hypothetical protein